MNNIQEEVRKLHLQLAQKDAIINQLKVLYKKKDGAIDDTVNEEQTNLELEKITKAQGDIEQDSKAHEQEMVMLLSSNRQIETSFISDICVSTMFNPNDMKQILLNHNVMLNNINTFEGQTIKLKEEIEDLK